jgi:hypothetical protein
MSVLAAGWAIDPDTTAATRVAVYVDAGGRTAAAGLARSDLATVYPHFGANHGFELTVPANPGQHRVCGYAINTVGSGLNQAIGCRTVVVPA